MPDWARRMRRPSPVRGWGLMLSAGMLAATMACDHTAARKSEAATTVYMIELESGAEATLQRAEGLMLAGKPDEARDLLRTRLDGLEEQVTKYITTDPELIAPDRERIIAAVREEQGRIRELLKSRPR